MILTLNCGSSSIKYALFTTTLKKIKTGNFENITDHENTLKTLFSSLTNEEKNQISTITHRIVHGGEKFTKTTKIDQTNLADLIALNDLAPLHNPIQVKCIQLCQKLFPQISNIAVFDTAFHQAMPEANYRYALPSEYYQTYKIRKYGFHGTSHQYLWETYKKTHAKSPKSTIITCHLGNGASIALIRNGKVIETSMGFTPTDGLIMGTRCGSIDPSIIPFIMQTQPLSPEQILTLLNKKSGLLALSETTNDMKILLEQQKSDPKAKLAVTMFVNSVVKYIGAYTALANGIDAIVFSGGIGERSAYIRKQIQKHLRFLGPIAYLTIPTDEEYQMAQETQKLIQKKLQE